VGLADGTTRTFRIIPGMTETGFVLSPLIESTRDFASLFGDRSMLWGKAVKSIRIVRSRGQNAILKISKLDMTCVAGRKATLLKVLNNLADIKSAGGVALRVRTQAGHPRPPAGSPTR
jgi:hypothetical protein